jgi:hypothetical protein
MDLITARNILETEERIAVLRNLIATLEPKGIDVSEHCRLLAAEERYLASGCEAPAHDAAAKNVEGKAAGWIMPPGSK